MDLFRCKVRLRVLGAGAVTAIQLTADSIILAQSKSVASCQRPPLTDEHRQ